MPQKRHTVDPIVAKLRKADIELGKGKKVPEICKLLEVAVQTYYLKTTFGFSKKTLFTQFLSTQRNVVERKGT